VLKQYEQLAHLPVLAGLVRGGGGERVGGAVRVLLALELVRVAAAVHTVEVQRALDAAVVGRQLCGQSDTAIEIVALPYVAGPHISTHDGTHREFGDWRWTKTGMAAEMHAQ
jgi:hypothetical protein